MNIIIIEDEKLASNDLVANITRLQPGACIAAQLFSVKESIFFFREKPKIDLVFSDIQLGDGTCFDIFSKVDVAAPVIFCTAYDEYALDAFHANGIDYILKPFNDDTLQAALDKYLSLKERFSQKPQPLEDLFKTLMLRKEQEPGALLVYHKDKIVPVAIADIAFFYLKSGSAHLTTFDNQDYQYSKTLDELEKSMGTSFFRVNRQCLVNRKAVVDATNHPLRKLIVTLRVPSEDIVVSKEKTSQFLQWLTVSN